MASAAGCNVCASWTGFEIFTVVNTDAELASAAVLVVVV